MHKLLKILSNCFNNGQSNVYLTMKYNNKLKTSYTRESNVLKIIVQRAITWDMMQGKLLRSQSTKMHCKCIHIFTSILLILALLVVS